MQPVVRVFGTIRTLALNTAQTALGGVLEQTGMQGPRGQVMDDGGTGTATASGPMGSTAGRAMAMNMEKALDGDRD